MTTRRPQSLEQPHQDQEDSQTREAHSTRQAVDMSPPGNAPVSTAHGIRPPSNEHHHTAFMQCRACCNCSAQCSYYGQGHFDAKGNYVGP